MRKSVALIFGTFHTKEEAALAYDVRAREVHGNLEGRTNFATMQEAEEAVRVGLAELEASGGSLSPIIHKTKKSKGEPATFGGSGKRKKHKKGTRKGNKEEEGEKDGSVVAKKQKVDDGERAQMVAGGGGGGGGFNPFGGCSPRDRLVGVGGVDFSAPLPKKKTTSVTDDLFGSFF